MKLYVIAFLVSLSIQAPSVTIQNGTVVGYTFGNVESFKGIPYAQPPVGSRRLRPPVPIVSAFGTITANADGLPCPTLGPTSDVPSTVRAALATTTPSDKDLFRTAPPTGKGGPAGPEDCLTINVQRPAGTQPGSKLPVLIWIYGGGFALGSANQYDGTQLISKAAFYSQPFIYVAFNYRLAAFGWLAGKELSDEGSTNLGLRDQRIAMQWVQDNIAAFGGNPSQVTIAGESAGSLSVFAHLQVNGGDNLYKGRPLFHRAIMDSGTTFPALPVRDSRPQGIFDRLAQNAGCGSAVDKLQCLRSVDYDTFRKAQDAATPSFFQVGIPYLIRPDPASSFFPNSPEIAPQTGAFAKVPMIIGTQADEGTFFVLTASQYGGSTERIVDLLAQQSPLAQRDYIRSYVNTYPGNFPQSITEGSPFGTGYANELYPGFKRLAALYGDALFTLARRYNLDYMANRTKIWSFISTYDQGLPFVGTTHGTDILCTFFGIGPLSAVAETQYRYLSFILHGNPNTLGLKQQGSGYFQWPQYSLGTRQLMNFGAFGPSYTTDDFRQDSYLILKKNYSSIAV